MEDHRLPKELLYGEVSEGKRSQGGKKKRFKDGVKTSMKALEIDPGNLEHLAKDRDEWHAALRQGANLHIKRRTETAVNRRGIRNFILIPPSFATIPCS